VTRGWGIKICLAVLLSCAAAPARSYDFPAECGGPATRWLEAYHRLHDAVEELRKAKKDPVGPKIEERLAKKSPRVSTAVIVRMVLDARKARIAQSREMITKLRGEEQERFKRLRRCGTIRRRFRALSKTVPELAERKRLKSRLSELLLDEAYVQYKNFRAPSSSSSYSSRPRRSLQWGPYGYGPPGFYTQGRRGARGFYR
jgi:hypothetical protein